jgi:hypothetical protein
MRYRGGVTCLVGIVGLCVGPSLLACGDKYLVAGRGARFQRGGPHAMAVLVYAPPSSSLAEGRLGKVTVDSVLSRAGYKPATVATPQQLADALRSGKADIVLAPAAEARTVERASSAGAPHPTIVPVLDKATRQEFAEARKEWGVALRSPASSDALLDAVDEAAELRAKAVKAAPAP